MRDTRRARVNVDHTTTYRSVQHSASLMEKRLRQALEETDFAQLKRGAEVRSPACHAHRA